MNAIGEEVARIGNKDDQAAFDLGKPSHEGVLERQGCSDPHQHANDQTAKEDRQENTNGLEHTPECQIALGTAGDFVSLSGLEQDNGNSIVQDRLAEDDGVKLGLDFVGVEDAQDGNGIGGGEGGADGNGFDKGQTQSIEGNACPNPEDQAERYGRYECASKSEGKNGANVAEEVGLKESDQYMAGSLRVAASV